VAFLHQIGDDRARRHDLEIATYIRVLGVQGPDYFMEACVVPFNRR